MNRPIFNDNPIFGNKLLRTSCPGKRDICGNLQGVLPTHIIPKCNDLTFQFSLNQEEAPNGCCVVETPDNTCKTYVPESTDLNGDSYDIGIPFFDENGENPRKICHSAPIRKRVMKIPQFLYSSLLSIVLVIVAICLGACYEFWLKYGINNNGNSGCGTFKYVDDCNNELDAIDYAFPSKLNDYPYKPCNSTKELDPPYNLLNFSDQGYDADLDFGSRFSKIFTAIWKAFCLNLLYTLFLSRLFISNILKTASARYQNWGDKAWGFKNVVFLFLTGVLFSVLAKYANIKEMKYGPGLIIYFLIMFVVFAMFATMLLTNFSLYWGPKFYNEKFAPEGSKISTGYALFANVLYEIRRYLKPFNPICLRNILLNIVLLLFILISYSFCLSTGFLGSIIGVLWMIMSLIYNIFVIPILNVGCFFSIISDHSYLITIMLCISVVLSSNGNLTPTITGILGGLVALGILWLTYQNISK